MLSQFGYYPGVLGVVSIALAVAVPFFALRGLSTTTASTLSGVAIQLTCLNIAATMLHILQITDTSDGVWPRDWMQEMFNGCVISSLTLPMIVTVPVLLYIACCRWPSRRFVLWTLASVTACVLAATGLVIAMSFAFGTLVYK